MKFAILIIEKNSQDRTAIESYLKRLSLPIKIVRHKAAEVQSNRVDIIIAGISGDSSSEVNTLSSELSRIRSHNPQAQTILCAPAHTKNLDKLLMKLQARAFLLKPLDITGFTTLLEKTLDIIRKRKVRQLYMKNSKRTSHILEIMGKSAKMQEVIDLLAKVSRSVDTSVLFLGESGTGKSLLAGALHEMSDCSNGPFIEINCSAIPSNLLESELFGYEAGAFTDAKSQKIGLIELAEKGTLFLDEITEVGIQTQAKLLKFLDTKKIRRLGGSQDIRVDARIIAASNRDLKEEVRERNFREDLYYRLNVVEITIPPLRERKEDISVITSYYLNEFRRKFKKPQLRMNEEAVELICQYRWPGNVRELINVIERAVLLATDDVIGKEDLPLPKKGRESILAVEKSMDNLTVKLPANGVNLEALEKKVIEETLKITRGNVLRASKLLGLSRGALRYKIKKHRLNPHSFSRTARELTKVFS